MNPSNIDPADFLTLVKTRRSIRQFESKPVPSEVLTKIVDAGVWAPTGSNRQELRFRIITDRDDLEALWQAKPHIKNPQAAILVYADLSDPYYAPLASRPHKLQLPLMDVGAACQNMLLTAHAFGLGAVWVSVSPYWHKAEALFKRFQTLENVRLSSAIFLGYPARVPDITQSVHAGKKIQRAAPEEYHLKIPLVSRVLLLHSLPRDHPNLGSQALSQGLREAIHNRMGDIPVAVLFHKDLHLQSFIPRLEALMDLEPAEALVQFRELVLEARAHTKYSAISELPFFAIVPTFLAPIWRLQRFSRRVYRKLISILYKPDLANPIEEPWVDDPLFGHRGRLGMNSLPPSLYIENKEIRLREKRVFGEKRAYRSALNLHKWLPRVFDLPLPLRPGSAGLYLMDWAQLVLVDGDGHLADPFWRTALRSLFNAALAKELGATTYSVNQTVDLGDPVLRRLAKYVYSHIDGVVLREPRSVEAVKGLGVRGSKLMLAADCAILVKDFRNAEAEELADRYEIAEGSIGLILRGDVQNDIAYWRAAVLQIQDVTKRPVVFLSSCEIADLAVGRQIQEKTGITVIEGLSDYELFVPFIRRFDAIISQRYHPLYFSLMANVPFLPLLGNTFKAKGLLQHFAYDVEVLDRPSLEELTMSVKHLLENADAIRARLPDVHSKLQSLAQLNVAMVPVHGDKRSDPRL